MDVFDTLLHGFSVALTPTNLLFCLLGVLLGQMVGIVPGIGPAAAISLLLPLTFGGDPIASTIMFAGIYYGALYGGTITSVLLSIPGESSSVMTAIDGHQLARQGRGGAALGIAAIGSFIAGVLGIIGLAVAAPLLARGALAFGPPEYFSLVVLGLTSLALVGGSLIKGLMMGVFGLCLATVGTDPQMGNTRFIFGQLWMLDGVEFLVLAVAIFGVGEVLSSAEHGVPPAKIESTFKSAWPTYADWIATRWAILRGSVLGFFIGVLPGAGATIASFLSYALEKRVSKHPEKFGHGAIEAVAGPESANNASSAGAMVPMFALGIPGSNTTAIMLGALVMFGLRPGPQLFEQSPDLVWGIIASMFIGNAILLVLNIPLAGLSVLLLRVRYALLYPMILAICIAGVYSQSNSVDDLFLLVAFGVLGYFMGRYQYPAAPLVLGLVLEPLFENALRQSMTIAQGSASIFFVRPISATLLLLTAVAVVWMSVSSYLRARSLRRGSQ